MAVSTKPILLLADSRAQSLERLCKKFQSRSPLIDLITVETGAKAMDIAIHHPVDAILMDSNLSDMSGAALADMIKKVRPEVTVIVLSEPLEMETHNASRKNGDAHYLDRNADLDQLISKVNSFLFEEQIGFRGLLDNLELPDILQLLCTRGETIRLRISSENNVGFVVIDRGEIIHARTNTKQGEEAFYELFGWKGGSFERQQSTRSEKRSINTPWQRLLLQASQLQDEKPPESANPAAKNISADRARSARATLSGAARAKSGRGLSTETAAGTVNESVSPALPAKPPGLREIKIQPYIHSLFSPGKEGRRSRITAETIMGYVAVAGIAWALVVGYSWLNVNNYADQLKQMVLKSGSLILDSSPEPAAQAPAPPVETPAFADQEGAGVCQILIAPLKEFAESGNVVAISGDTFDRLGLRGNPWVELTTLRGKKMGAYAIRKDAAPATIYIRKTMALALDVDSYPPSYLQVKAVTLARDLTTSDTLSFAATRTLAPQYCEYWYAAGVALNVMEEAKLAPGSYAIIRGPQGYQSVQLQVMDRGNPEEIWLSEPVREAIGLTEGSDHVVLFPKDYIWLDEESLNKS